MAKSERLRWQKSTEREWDVSLVVVEEQELAQQGCELVSVTNKGQSNKKDPQKMAFESLNVRLTRSNASISWGFDFQQRGADLVVSKVDPGSMAEKAGICLNDTVQDILNQKAGTLQQAQGRIQNASEITLTLRRPIKNSPSMPWAFQTNANGQLAVDQYDAQGRVVQRSDPQTKGFQESFISQSQAPADFEQRRSLKGSDEVRSTNGPPAGIQQQQLNLPYNNVTHRAENHDDGQTIRQYESRRSYTRTESTTVPPSDSQQQQWTAQNQSKQNVQVGQKAPLGSAPQQPQNVPYLQQPSGQNRQQITTTQQQRQTVATGPNPQSFGGQQYAQPVQSQQVAAAQKDKSVALPGGVDYTQQNGHSTNLSRTANQQSQQNQEPEHTYKISQYEQTDSINFAAPGYQTGGQRQSGVQSQQAIAQNQQFGGQKVGQSTQQQSGPGKEPQSLAQFLQKQAPPKVPAKPSQNRIQQQGVGSQSYEQNVQPGGQNYNQQQGIGSVGSQSYEQNVQPGGQNYNQQQGVGSVGSQSYNQQNVQNIQRTQSQTTTYQQQGVGGQNYNQQNVQPGGQSYNQQQGVGSQSYNQQNAQNIQRTQNQIGQVQSGVQPGGQSYNQQQGIGSQRVQQQQAPTQNTQQISGQSYNQQQGPTQNFQQNTQQTTYQQNVQQISGQSYNQQQAPSQNFQQTNQQISGQSFQPQQRNPYLSGQIQHYQNTTTAEDNSYNQQVPGQRTPAQNYSQQNQAFSGQNGVQKFAGQQQSVQRPGQFGNQQSNQYYQYNQGDLSASNYNSLPRQSRSAHFAGGQYAEAPEWQSQTLDRSYQLRREPARRSRSQPRCCSRNDALPGPIIYYCPPQARTYRELSPSARVRHLQYNTPLDLYSDDAAAEAYFNATGQQLHFRYIGEPVFQSTDAYSESETRRLIQEQELGIRPQVAPPIQSASLKRIARAVGVPLD